METHATIDWLTYSAPNGYQLDDIVPELFNIEHENRIEALPYYTHAISMIPAGRIDWNLFKESQGMRVTLTGSDLRTCESEGLSKTAIIDSLKNREYLKPTRIDIALDLVGGISNPDDIYTEWENKRVNTRAREINQIRGLCKETKRTGNTVYIGNRTGENYLRVYDKGIERKLDDMLWSRIELELKGSKAVLAAGMIQAQGLPKTARAALDRFVKFPNLEWWAEMLSALPYADERDMVGQSHMTKDSKHWLHTQALPAVLRAIIAGDSMVVTQIEQALNELWGGNILTCE